MVLARSMRETRNLSSFAMTGKQSQLRTPFTNGFAAVEGNLELIPAIVEDDGFAGGIDVADEAVELGNVIDGEIIARADLDDLPILVWRR